MIRAVGAGCLLAAVALATAMPAWQDAHRSRDLVVPAAVPGVTVAPAAGPSVAAAPGARSVVDPAWVRRVAGAAGIPEPAVRAYADAVLSAPPACGLGWTTLAGIGWVESHHGTLGGRVLDTAGISQPPIVGPALDGQGDVKAIRATGPGLALHGDPRWEHAVGPLQFLPGTWETWGRDADRDGRADPNDLDDAAAAAAAYLCADGQDLATGAGWATAVHTYNHSDAYVRAVYDAAVVYSNRTP